MANNQRKLRNEKNATRPKAGAGKVANVSKIAAKLDARVKVEGETAWLKDAKKRIAARAKRYGVKLPA